MKKIKIISPDYLGYVERERVATRAIIIKDDKILLGYEAKPDQYIIPGGGLEKGETLDECVVREVKEETGLIIEPIKCYLEITELFLTIKHINYYYFVSITSETGETSLTQGEINEGLTSRWVETNEAVKIFSKYNDYRGNVEKYGLYKRELKALKEALKK